MNKYNNSTCMCVHVFKLMQYDRVFHDRLVSSSSSLGTVERLPQETTLGRVANTDLTNYKREREKDD